MKISPLLKPAAGFLLFLIDMDIAGVDGLGLKYPDFTVALMQGLEIVIRRLDPKVIVIYGAAPDKYFDIYRKAGIRIVQFDSSFAVSHKEAV